ncbi:hypothetical protein PC120_g3407 [Phytophthora cactorum]|nr:hypothetical protein PC120_g3407 [Phytophthora cactorum]
MTMPLGTKYVDEKATSGAILLVYQEDMWLNLSCVITGMMYLRHVYKDIVVYVSTICEVQQAHYRRFEHNWGTLDCFLYRPKNEYLSNVRSPARKRQEDDQRTSKTLSTR